MTNLGTVAVINLSGSSGAGGNISAGQIILTDGITEFRIIVRNSAIAIDEALTVPGFTGIESEDLGVTGDWINLTDFKKQ